MVTIKDMYNKDIECLYILERPMYQNKTGDTFFVIEGVGYDGIRRKIMYRFDNEKEMHEKYAELYKEYMYKHKKEILEKGGRIND